MSRRRPLIEAGSEMIRLTLTPNGDLPSQLTLALRGRAVDLAPETTDEPHLYTGLALRWRSVVETASHALRELRQLQVEASDAVFKPAAATVALKNLIYAATELYDLYAQALPKRLEAGRPKADVRAIRDYQGRVKRLRDPIALMCNRMKHNYRDIVGGRIVSEPSGAMTFVYRINVARDGLQRGDPDIHQDDAFYSIERTLHEILHGLLRADHNAAGLVGQLSDNADQVMALSGPKQLGLAAILTDLTGQTPIVASSEPARFDGLAIKGNELLLVRVAAKKVPEPTRRTVHMTVDEAALSVELMV